MGFLLLILVCLAIVIVYLYQAQPEIFKSNSKISFILFSIVIFTFIISVVKNIANKVVVMNKGKIEETGETIEIFQNPKSEYTKTLIRAIPTVTDEEDATKP